MAIVSKYSNQQVETLMHEMLSVLEKRKTPIDLALMTLGNVATVLINDRVDPAQRETIAKQFSEALQASVSPSKES